MPRCTFRIARHALAVLAMAALATLLPTTSHATSQWAKKTGMSCTDCHTVFPRLNATGAAYLEDGYQLKSAHDDDTYDKDVYLSNVNHLLGFRLNMTPFQVETNSLQVDTLANKELRNRYTIGSPVWIQFFVAGNIYRDISFFSELEYAQSAFKFNWFYFNFTNIAKTPAINFQLGNISPLEFASYPNRLPQLPAIKGEVFLVKSSNGLGEESLDMSSARPGLQYFGKTPAILWYAGVSPGTSARDKNQYLQTWAGVVARIPENGANKFSGSNATLHFYRGTDTKGTGTRQFENAFTRVSPQLNLRWNEKIDVQAAYVMGTDKNRALIASPSADFKYHGVAIEAGYMPTAVWHLGVHYDQYRSDNKVGNVSVLDYERIVPAVTYVINQNFRTSVYYEHDLGELPASQKVQKLYMNLRCMF